MDRLAPERAPLETVLFDGPLVRIGAFRAHPRHPRFHDSGPIENHVFVFPRTSVWIQHEGRSAFVGDPTVVTFYNRGEVYRREPIAEEGDRCEWFAVTAPVLLEAVRRFEPEAEDHFERPFPMSHGPSDAQTYARQRRLAQALAGSTRPDPLRVEETVLELLDAVLAAAGGIPGRAPPRTPCVLQRRHRDLAEAAKALLAAAFKENWALGDVADALDVAPGHLCRVFRRQTGTTLHAYRDQLRLRAALESLAEPRLDLTQLALELGYSSHSHFTERFRRAFATTPSAFRTQAARSGRAGSIP